MNVMKFKRVDEIVEWRLCLGCGACVPACENRAITLVNVCDEGIRPMVDVSQCRACGRCVEVCPGIEISREPSSDRDRVIPELSQAWGPVLEVWEGYASDPEIRFRGSSGGAATALALYCLEKQKASGVLHVTAGAADPLENVAVFSRTRMELMARTGSRYSPAAPCEKLPWIQDASRPSVFIGKPCDVVALRKSQAVNAALRKNVVAAISIFCAGTPATAGTYRVLDELNVDVRDVEDFRYRGYGWPGMTTVRTKDPTQTRQMTYEQSWGKILCNYIQFRCRLCPDSTGEFADISCGDPWYRPVEDREPGRSLVLARTEKGRRIIQEAIEAGYLQLSRVGANTVPDSQKALLNRRRHLWGRLFVMRLLLVPIPRYDGFDLFGNWLKLPIVEKLRSFAGTIKRIVSRGWTKPRKLFVGAGNVQPDEAAKQTSTNIGEVNSRCKV
jgi:coenzyme F420 hydrogenase subunit beta